MNPFSLLDYFINKKAVLKIHEIIIDRAEIFIEKSDIDPNLLNVWHNLGRYIINLLFILLYS